MQHAKSKHIARRDLFLRELVERGITVPKYVPTSANIADVKECSQLQVCTGVQEKA